MRPASELMLTIQPARRSIMGSRTARVMDAWTSFARVGVPHASDLPEWLPYTTERRETLLLGTPCSMELDPGAVTRRLWDGNL